MRLGRVLIVVGIVIIASVALFRMYPIRDSVGVRDDVPYGLIFNASSNIHVEVSMDENVGVGVFSMYLLEGIDANNTVAQNKSITLATPLAQFENITSFDDTLSLPGPGVYVLYFTSPESEMLLLNIFVSHINTNLRLLSGGIILVSIGLIVIVTSNVLKKKKVKEPTIPKMQSSQVSELKTQA